MLKILKTIPLILKSSILSPLAALSIPKIENIIGMKIKNVTLEHSPREEYSMFNPNLSTPEMIDIKYGQKRIVLNLETKTFEEISEDMEPYSFIDDEGLFIFGIPGIILFLPVIALSDALWHTVSRITNMNHNHYLFYNRIKGSLDLETSQILKDCLINLSKEDT